MLLSIERKLLKHNRLLIEIILKLYICLIFLYLLPLFIFSTKLVILGVTVSQPFTAITYIFLISLLFFLYFSIKKEKISGLIAAIIFHSFFILNTTLIFMGKPPIINIEGLKPVSDPGFKTPIIMINLAINLSIIFYLLLYYLRALRGKNK